MRKSAKITLVTLTQMHNIKQGKNYSPGSTQLSKIELIILSQVFFCIIRCLAFVQSTLPNDVK